jgi:hypothetical protein
MRPPSKIVLRAVLALGVAILALGVISVRLLHHSASALERAERAAAHGRAPEAITAYFEAARAYLPGSSSVAQALDGLVEVAAQAAARGDLETERQALEAIRSALLSVSSFYTPFEDRLRQANRRLAILYADIDRGASPETAGLPNQQRTAGHLARLQGTPGPSPAHAALALLGFVAWIAAIVAFIFRGLDRSTRLHPRWAPLCAGVFLLGFTLFVIGLRLA